MLLSLQFYFPNSSIYVFYIINLLFWCWLKFYCFLFYSLCNLRSCIGAARDSLVTQLVKSLPEMQETQFRSLGWEDPLEKGIAIHSSILVWRISWTTVHGVLKSQTRLSDFHFQYQVLLAKCRVKQKVFSIFFLLSSGIKKKKKSWNFEKGFALWKEPKSL